MSEHARVDGFAAIWTHVHHCALTILLHTMVIPWGCRPKNTALTVRNVTSHVPYGPSLLPLAFHSPWYRTRADSAGVDDNRVCDNTLALMQHTAVVCSFPLQWLLLYSGHCLPQTSCLLVGVPMRMLLEAPCGAGQVMMTASRGQPFVLCKHTYYSSTCRVVYAPPVLS